MAQIGQILIKEARLTQDGLEEALDWQVLYGGRLGTNLLELRLVEEEQLARALGKQLGAEVAWGDLQIDPALIGAIPPHVADRQQVVPWKLEKRRIKILCCDIRVGELDQLSYKLGRTCVPVVAPEFRVFQLLRAHYGAKRQMRALDFGVVPEEGRAERRRRKEKESGRVVEDAPELIDESAFNDIYAKVLAGRSAEKKPPASAWDWPQSYGPPPPGWQPFETAPDQALVVEPVAADVHEPPAAPVASAPRVAATPVAKAAPPRVAPAQAAPPRVAPAPVAQPPPRVVPAPVAPAPVPARAKAPEPEPEVLEPLPEDAILEPLQPATWEEPEPPAAPAIDESPLDFKEALRLLQGVTDRDAIARIVLRAARSFAQRALLLQVQGNVALGWEGLGEGLSGGAARGVAIQLSSASAFMLVVRTRSHYLGPLQKTPLNIRFLAELGKKVPLSSLIVPILHRGRVSHLLYLDNGHRQQAPTDVGEMLILSQRIGQTVDALVEQKRKAARA